jgi:hypothetical protein
MWAIAAGITSSGGEGQGGRRGGGQLLAGDAAALAGSGGSRGGQPGITDGAVAGAGIAPRLDHDHGLVGQGALPGVEGDGAVAALGLGVGGAARRRAPRVVE